MRRPARVSLWVSALIGLWVASRLTWGPGGVARRLAAGPPGDAAVLQALPRPLPGVSRDDIVIVTEPVGPGQWNCTAYYIESVQLPWWGRVRIGTKAQSVAFQQD